jgi:hypothetical protein
MAPRNVQLEEPSCFNDVNFNIKWLKMTVGRYIVNVNQFRSYTDQTSASRLSIETSEAVPILELSDITFSRKSAIQSRSSRLTLLSVQVSADLCKSLGPHLSIIYVQTREIEYNRDLPLVADGMAFDFGNESVVMKTLSAGPDPDQFLTVSNVKLVASMSSPEDLKPIASTF